MPSRSSTTIASRGAFEAARICGAVERLLHDLPVRFRQREVGLARLRAYDEQLHARAFGGQRLQRHDMLAR